MKIDTNTKTKLKTSNETANTIVCSRLDSRSGSNTGIATGGVGKLIFQGRSLGYIENVPCTSNTGIPTARGTKSGTSGFESSGGAGVASTSGSYLAGVESSSSTGGDIYFPGKYKDKTSKLKLRRKISTNVTFAGRDVTLTSSSSSRGKRKHKNKLPQHISIPTLTDAGILTATNTNIINLISSDSNDSDKEIPEPAFSAFLLVDVTKFKEQSSVGERW